MQELKTVTKEEHVRLTARAGRRYLTAGRGCVIPTGKYIQRARKPAPESEIAVPRRTAARLKLNVREKLLASATLLFNRRGYAATTVREIVLAAGVTKPVLYHYFGSKEGIYLEIMRRFLGYFEERLEEFRSRRGSARERVQRLCDELFSLCLENMGTFKLVYAIYYGPPQGAPRFDFDAFYAELLRAMRQVVTEGIRNGEFRRGSPDDMSQAILGALTVALESHMAHTPVYVGNRGLARILRIIFTGLQTDDSKGKGKSHAVSSIRRSHTPLVLPQRQRVFKKSHG